MMDRIEEVVVVHVHHQLLEHGSLQHLAQDWHDGHRPVVFRLQFACFSSIQRHNLGNLPLGRKFVKAHRHVQYMTHRGYNNFLDQL